MTKTTYRVVGPNRFDGHDPGSTYKANYSPEHEQYAITAGHIEIVAENTGDLSEPSNSSS